MAGVRSPARKWAAMKTITLLKVGIPRPTVCMMVSSSCQVPYADCVATQAFFPASASVLQNQHKVTWQHYQESEAIAVLGHLMKPFPLICTVCALFCTECILMICTTIQYKTVAKQRPVTHKIGNQTAVFSADQPRSLCNNYSPPLHSVLYFSRWTLCIKPQY